MAFEKHAIDPVRDYTKNMQLIASLLFIHAHMPSKSEPMQYLQQPGLIVTCSPPAVFGFLQILFYTKSCFEECFYHAR